MTSNCQDTKAAKLLTEDAKFFSWRLINVLGVLCVLAVVNVSY
jgi:hypothetical protein